MQNYDRAKVVGRDALAFESEMVVQSVSGSLAVIDTALQSVAAARRQDLAYGSRSRLEIEANLAAVADALPQVDMFALVDTAGRVAYASSQEVPRNLDVSDRQYFRVFADGTGAKEPFLMPPALTRIKAEWFVGMSRPVRNSMDNVFDGVVVAVVQASWFHNGYLRKKAPKGYVTALFMDGGVVVDAVDPFARTGQWSGSRVTELPAFGRIGDVDITLPPAGETRRIETATGSMILQRVGDFPLGVLVYADWPTLLEGWQQDMILDVAGLGAVVLLLALLWIPISKAGRERDRLFYISRDPVAVFGLDGRFLRANPAWEALLGMSQDELTGQSAFSLIHPDDYEASRLILGRLLAGEHIEDFTCRIVPASGQVVWLSWSAVAENGRIFSITRDVTRRLQVEDQLRIGEQRFRDVVEASGEFVWEADVDGRITYVSDRTRSILGRDPEGLIGQRLIDLVIGSERSALEGAFRRVSSFRLELRTMRADDQQVWLRLVGRPVRATTGVVEGFRGACLDITDAHQARQAVAESEARYRSIVNTVVDGIITIDERGIIQSINPAGERIFEYSARELVGRNVSCLMDEPHRGQHDGYLANYMRTGTAKIIGIGREVYGLRKSGEAFPLDLGISEVWFGNQRFFIGMCRDVSERKRIERLKDEFVSTVSHELRTPLTSIRGSLGLISGGAVGAVPDKVSRLVNIALSNCERLVNLVNDILDIQKIESGRMAFDMRPVDLVVLSRRAVEEMGGFARQYEVNIEFATGADSILVRGDADRLVQVIVNLLSNAAKFSPKGETVSLDLTVVNDRVTISVSDNGPGIPESFRSSIFSKFSQADSTDTRSKGGTGLGLSIVKAIVEAHDGTIGFISEVGKGATFIVDLPLPPVVEAQPTLDIENAMASLAGSRRLLIVEDDPDVASLLRLMVQNEGFSADIALDGATARTLLAANTYDAMTCDVLLPDGDGLSLVRDLRADGSIGDLPVIIISAVASQTDRRLEGSMIGVSEWLSKPIDDRRLRDVLQGVIPNSASGLLKVLHVEDDQDVRNVISMSLNAVAVTSHAASLEEARRQLAGQAFDLVLLDIGLPDGSGLDLLKDIQALDPGPQVVLLSGQAADSTALDGVAAALIKSKVDNDELVAVIRRVVASTGTAGKNNKGGE